jgi:diguanylate cyclase (GGDEF)-like protein
MHKPAGQPSLGAASNVCLYRGAQATQDGAAGLAARFAERDQAVAWLHRAEQVARVGHFRVRLADHAVTWSPETYRLHGVTPDTHTPDYRTSLGLCHPDDRPAMAMHFERAARDGTPFDLRLRLLRHTGEIRRVQCRGETLPGPDGRPATIFGVLIDVTEQFDTESQLRAENLQLDNFAHIDGLTGIANRRRFDEVLEREWQAASRSRSRLSVVMVDVDRFKAYNDRYGHQAGDSCLHHVAQALYGVPNRATDLVARYGGEEFVILLPATDAEGAARIAERGRADIQALALEHAGNPSGGGHVSISAGVATLVPPDDAAPAGSQALVAEADAALYEAKRTGRNRVVAPQVQGWLVPMPADETDRLAALAVYDASGATRRSAALDGIARTAARLLGTPIGLVSLLGRETQKFAGNFGLEQLDGTSRDLSFCAHTILGEDPMVVPDATRDARFQDNALVTGDLGLRYYAGAPIVSQGSGHRLGALCVLDKTGRSITSPAQRAILTDLAQMAAALIEDAATNQPAG